VIAKYVPGNTIQFHKDRNFKKIFPWYIGIFVAKSVCRSPRLMLGNFKLSKVEMLHGVYPERKLDSSLRSE
jgi:hypothetical protein